MEKLCCRVRVGWSFLFQVMLLIHRASNFDTARSTSAPAMAGSRANARMVSVVVVPRPVNWVCCSFSTPGLTGEPPTFPCSRATAIASLRVSNRGGRDGSRTVAGAMPVGTPTG